MVKVALYSCLTLLAIGISASLSVHLAQDSLPNLITQHVLSNQAGPQVAQISKVPGIPIRIVIDKINVNAPIENVGLTSSGNMAVPSQANMVGWYQYGQRPGEQGAAVLAGHLDDVRGQSDIFANLHLVERGDTFSILDDAGQTSTFVVTEIRIYNQNEKPTEVFTASAGMHVNLITCAGSWDKDLNRFTKRLVVFGEKSV